MYCAVKLKGVVISYLCCKLSGCSENVMYITVVNFVATALRGGKNECDGRWDM